MNVLNRLLGPESKYDRGIPYTYQAIVSIPCVDGMTHSYVGDTLCSLLERLDSERVVPDEVRIFEVWPEGEVPILIEHCTGPGGAWLHRPDACRSFAEHYKGHEAHSRCCFRDRSRAVDGPFVEIGNRRAPTAA